jgi:hypothetical protein
MCDEVWQRKDADALSKIRQGVSDTIFLRIMNSSSTTKQVWGTLRDEFQGLYHCLSQEQKRHQSYTRDYPT